MKFCEKCGNKLKEGYVFCDKCGTKIKDSKKEEKKKEVETKKEDTTPIKQVPPYIPIKQKTNKGKVIFLSIMNILLLASTITFLVLWLTKPTITKNIKEKDIITKDEKKFIGDWGQNVEYKVKTRLIQRVYESIEIKDNKTFRIVRYDKDNIADSKEEISGIYKVKGNKIELTWNDNKKIEERTYELDGNKLCIAEDCSNYLLKNSDNSKITIQIEEKSIDTITYNEYNRLLNSKKDAIVVVVREGCYWCESFDIILKDLVYFYDTPIYYYEIDENIDISSTPTSIIIKNGKIIDLIEGYKDIYSVKKILNDLGIK